MGIQLRLEIVGAMLLTEKEYVVLHDTSFLTTFFKGAEGLTIIALYVGINHYFIVKDLFSEERS